MTLDFDLTPENFADFNARTRLWYNQLPRDWIAKQLKYALLCNDGGTWGGEPDGGEQDRIVLRSTEQLVDGTWRLEDPAVRKLTAEEFAKTKLEADDLVITKSSGSELHIGKTSIVNDEIAQMGCAFSNFMQRLRPDASTSAQFIYYLLNSIVGREQMAWLSNTTTGLANLSGSLLDELVFLFPPLNQQRHIAAYLDRETARIDALIAAKQELLQTLAEKRQALITSAVTRGLDASAPRKASGLSWFEEVPAHWLVVGMTKYLTSLVDYRGKTPVKTESGAFLVTARNIRNGVIDYSLSQEYIAQDAYDDVMSRGLPALGDILLTTEAPLGQVAMIDREDVALAQRVIKLRYDQNVLTQEYALYWFLSSAFQAQLWSYATGSTAEGIKGERVHLIRNLIPPVSEQKEIVKYIKNALLPISGILQVTVSSIEMLKQRRAALIAAAVTGQIAITDAAAQG